MKQTLTAEELRLADVVQLSGEEGFNTAVIKQLERKDGRLCISFYRPYVHTDDFSYTGGVICYLGLEEWTINPHMGETFTVLRRKILK